MKMTTAQRHELILQDLRSEGFVSVPALAERLGVSDMTIRRDLGRLAETGLLERTHGGAAPVRSPGALHVDLVEPSLKDRLHASGAQKLAIARTAARMVSPGQTIALDIGTTTGHLAAELRETQVSIYTSSLKIAAQMAGSRAMVYVPGGLIAGIEPSIVGARAVDHLRQLNFEIAFLGASSLSENGTFFDYSLEDAEIKRVLTEVSSQVVMLLDSSKFNRVSVASICDGSKVDTLITDQEPPEHTRARLVERGTKIIIAK
ncbi:DeoR/GlpR family DNA-binding transcription regulator [Oceanibium sediminis]|uniref:DeoR/GlpR family DNA-binding transcription regulator n=1 Tax=Oceanibium sediminis TaxID=2026339 RepID=UPI0018E57685|nr:DeoR/GlpR family DNA-binding transcription regulator [Oceanibium sediminis]